MSDLKAYPQPYEDADNHEFLEGWRNGQLFLQQSEDGGPLFFYPRPICPYTGSDKLVSKRVSGRGNVVSYSLILRPNHPAFAEETPIILAEIRLVEGASLLGRIVCEKSEKISSGLAVKLLPMPEAAKYPLPTFSIVLDATV